MYQLVIADDTGATTVLPFVREEFSVGRGEGNAIRLTERNVSRKHARLLLEQGAIFVEDLASFNGTWVNGDRILGRVPLSAGDAVAIGDYLFSLRPLAEARSPAAPAPAELDRLGGPSGPAQRIAEVTRVGPVPAQQVQPTVTRAPQERRREKRLPVVLLGLCGMGLIVTAGFLAGQHYRRAPQTSDRTARATEPRPSPAAPPSPVAAIVAPPRPAPPQVQQPAPASQPVVFHEERPALAQAPVRERRRQQPGPPEHLRKAPVAAGAGAQEAAVAVPAKVAEQPGSPEKGEALLRQADDRYANGEYGEAVRLAKQGRDMGAPASKAWRILGRAACGLRDLKLVDEAYRRSEPNVRQSLIYVCDRSGVNFASGHFQLGEGQSGGDTAQR